MWTKHIAVSLLFVNGCGQKNMGYYETCVQHFQALEMVLDFGKLENFNYLNVAFISLPCGT